MKINNYLKILSFLVLAFLNNSLTALELPDLRPVPWVTHEAVCFLEEFMNEHPNAKVLEFGSGASTVWFAKRTPYLVSLEHSSAWYKDLQKLLNNTKECHPVKYIFRKKPYYEVCNQFPDEYFDLVLVDGRNRKGCIKYAIRTLKKGGVLMLDNAERPYYKLALDLLKNWECVKTVQTEPDTCDFMYDNWQTHWFIKP